MAEEIADHKCSISFNEVLSGRPGDLFHPKGMRSYDGCLYPQSVPCDLLADGCGGLSWRQRRRGEHVVRILKSMRARYCAQHKREQCGGKCVVVLKLFAGHLQPAEPDDSPFSGHQLEGLFSYEGTRVVVVERDPNEEECSYNYSLATRQWHGIDKQAESHWEMEHCNELASPQFMSRLSSTFPSTQRQGGVLFRRICPEL